MKAPSAQRSEVVKRPSGVRPVWISSIVAVGIVLLAIAVSPTFQRCIEQGITESGNGGVPSWLRCGAVALDANHNLTLAIATIVLAIFTISLWAATNQLRRSTDNLLAAGERQIETMRETLITANRPWVFTQPWPRSFEFYENGRIIFRGMELRLYGSSPATVTELYVGFAETEPSGDAAAFPGQSIKATYNLAPGNQWFYNDEFTTTDARPYVFGYVRYIDQFGCKRESRYCYRLSQGDELNFRAAGSPVWSHFD